MGRASGKSLRRLRRCRTKEGAACVEVFRAQIKNLGDARAGAPEGLKKKCGFHGGFLRDETRDVLGGNAGEGAVAGTLEIGTHGYISIRG